MVQVHYMELWTRDFYYILLLYYGQWYSTIYSRVDENLVSVFGTRLSFICLSYLLTIIDLTLRTEPFSNKYRRLHLWDIVKADEYIFGA